MMTRRSAAVRGPRWRALLALPLGALFLSACGDSGPSGPGALPAMVTGPVQLGAAVVDVTGPGITGFEGAGSSRTFATSTGPDAHRVIVVGATPGELHFRILVEDRGAALPGAAVVSAVDGSNLPLSSVTGYSVKVSR